MLITNTQLVDIILYLKNVFILETNYLYVNNNDNSINITEPRWRITSSRVWEFNNANT